ncbi:hypothetical protein PYH69_00280 [Mammaliicoccus lentus]|uniref:Uncharacterized protein n=1 Tax=Mammaliicoccus lentus TaxID=42858 RepID=A0AAX3W4M2_MAMLE|nr:hypothetical protein [Mammaliicoccus lentus]WHI60122.1 hypothetical protein PYH69_00280 [Mammaliicoccus lentus]
MTLNFISIICGLIFGLLQCIYGVRSFKLQQKQALERDKSKTTTMNNKNEVTTNGNNNSYHTIQVNHYHDEIDLTKDEISQRKPQKTTIYIALGLIILTIFTTSILQQQDSSSLVLFSFIFDPFLITLKNSLYTLVIGGLITSIVLFVLGTKLQSKITIYTGILHLINCVCSLYFLKTINFTYAINTLLNPDRTALLTMQSITVILSFLILLGIFCRITAASIDYISGYSKNLNNSTDFKLLTINAELKRLLIPLIPMIIIAISTFLLNMNGLETIGSIIIELVEKIINELKTKVFSGF